MENPLTSEEVRLLAPILPVKTMVELGNKKNAKGVYKKWFASQGVNHISIDWNGEDGAWPLDLNQPIPVAFWPEVDVVTNFGTSEHVENQERCFENIDAMNPKWSVHAVPLIGNWYGHGLKTCGFECYKYTEEDFMEIGLKYGYTIEDLFIGGRPGKQLLCVRFRHPA